MLEKNPAEFLLISRHFRSLNATPTNATVISHSTPVNASASSPQGPSTVSIGPDRKYSVPTYPSGQSQGGSASGDIKMRDKTGNSVPSRPSSLIENAELKVFEIGNLGDHGGLGGIHRLGVPGLPDSSVTSRGSSQADLLECGASLASTDSHGPKSPLLPGSRELLEVKT